MQSDDTKMFLPESTLHQMRQRCPAAAAEFLKKRGLLANVQGMGIGVKWKDGQPTGEEAFVVLVSKKIPKEHLSRKDLIPPTLNGVQTDVLEIGVPEIQAIAAEQLDLRTKVRPAIGGVSVSHPKVTAGTLGITVSDRRTVPHRFFVLSNNHVLANSNRAHIGDPILQPGTVDGGRLPTDVLGHLHRFVPVQLEPPLERDLHNNYVDAALAEVNPIDVSPEIAFTGFVTGFLAADEINVGMPVRKVGRTTGYTTGRVTVISATVDVSYGQGTIARFSDQIITTAMSHSGDSGSLITTFDNLAVGLLFAGSSSATISNPIEHVQDFLDIQVAPC